MDELLLKNFRCFGSPAPMPLGPITLLVGENSTGKSAFLAATRLAWDIALGMLPLDFNDPPFLLGSYDQIAYNHGGQNQQAEKFEIGTKIKLPEIKRKGKRKFPHRFFKVSSVFRSRLSEPEFDQIDLSLGDNRVQLKFEPDNQNIDVTISSKNFSRDLRIRNTYAALENIPVHIGVPRLFLFLSEIRQELLRSKTEDSEKTETIIDGFGKAIFLAHTSWSLRPYAFAPVRTKPKRTYDQVADLPEPEGGHVPMVLAKMFLEGTQEWARIQRELKSFGRKSGLFKNLEIKQFGKKGADPFQLNIQISDRPSNLIDVGYGVSQILPVLVETINHAKNSVFLMQQPEVHLHPRAQAELGSFLVKMARYRKYKFIVETHSDYIIDRIRADVRDNKALSPDDVSILFFHQRGKKSSVSRLRLDENGNLFDVPKNYRRFFLHEDRRSLGVI